MNGGFLSLVKAVTSCCIFTSVLLRTQDSAWIVLGSFWLCGPSTSSCACLYGKTHDPIVCVLGIGGRQCSGTSPSVPSQSPDKSVFRKTIRLSHCVRMHARLSKTGSVTMPPTLPPVVRFGNFEVDLRAGELRKEGNKVRLQEQPYLLLTVLLESAGEVVTREELRKRLWSADTFVDFDHRLAVAVSKLRDALQDSAEKPKFVETIGRRGYRFIGQLESTDSLSVDSKTELRETVISSHPAAQEALPKVALQHWSRSRTSRLILLSSAVFIILLSLMALPKFVHIRPGKKELSLAPRSLAILPLQNHGEDSNSDFLGLSLADVLITKLAYVNSLSVRPSAAVEKYRKATIDVQKVAADLKVDTLLTGSFVRDGDNLRITYQLVDAKTEKILGQGVIDLKYDNLLAVQDKVSSQLISELQLTLSPSEAGRLKPENPVSPLAYEYFLQGLDFHGQHKFPLAIKMLETSTEIDPNYAPAWA